MALKLDAKRAHDAFREQVAGPLGLKVEEAAHGVFRIAASNMIRAIRAVSSERGRDPRGFTLFPFGGNGPLFACEMAEALGMKRIVVPPAPGLFSSFGLLYSDIEHHYSRTLRRVTHDADPSEISAAWRELEDQARAQLAADGLRPDQISIQRLAALHYYGQSFDLVVPAKDGIVDALYLDALAEAFGAEHERMYGHRASADEPVELVSIQVLGIGLRDDGGVPERVVSSRPEPEPSQPRQVYFGANHGWMETPIVRRSDLATEYQGPAIVAEYDATCVVAPGATASLDSGGNIVITLQ